VNRTFRSLPARSANRPFHPAGFSTYRQRQGRLLDEQQFADIIIKQGARARSRASTMSRVLNLRRAITPSRRNSAASPPPARDLAIAWIELHRDIGRSAGEARGA